MSGNEPVLVIEVVGEGTAPAALPGQGVLVIGSSPAKAGLVVSGQGVAEVHCAIGRTKDGGWAVKDLGSEYGTLHNGRKITQARLQAGDQLLLGSRRLTVLADGAAAPVAAPSPEPTAPRAPAEPAQKLPSIRGYRTIQRLGRGAMGDVFLAVQESLDREVAMKVLSERLEEDQAFVESFQAEARSAAALNHPNVVTVHDVGERDGVHYLTMEFMDRGSLEERVVREGPLHWRAVLDVMVDSASGLVYAESRGIVHRDIKPANLMQNHTETTKIADLGLATRVQDETLDDGSRKIFGTPHFISPEQVRGEMADCRSDLYSLGATAYRLLTGHTPFEGDDSREILRAKLTRDPTPLRHYITDVPEALVQIVDRLMRRDPAERFPSASSLLKELERLRNGNEAAQVGAPVKGGSNLSRLVVPIVFLVVVGIASLAIFGGGTDDPGPDPTGPEGPGPGVGGSPDEPEEPIGGDPDKPVVEDDDTQEKIFELKARNALLSLNQRELSKAERRDTLRALAADFAGTTAATEAGEEADRLDTEVMQENRAQLERESSIAQVLAALRTAARLDADPVNARNSLLAMAAVPGQEELAADPLFQEKRRALVAEVLTRTVTALQQGLEKVEEHYAQGDFEGMRELLGDLLRLTDLPEFEAEETPPDAAEILELRTTIRNRLASIDDLEVEFAAGQVIADKAAVTEALRGSGGLASDLLALDFTAATDRIDSLQGRLATESALDWAGDLSELLHTARGAIPILIANWDQWRRKTVPDPRGGRGGSHEALGVDEEGLRLNVRGEQELVPWSAYGGRTHDLNTLFTGRLSRPYTDEEKDSIGALMSLSAIAEAISQASEMFTPGSGAVFTEKESRELPLAFEKAAEWCRDEEARLALGRERRAAELLGEGLRYATETSWANAASSLELLLESYPDTLLVRMLSDGMGH